VNRHQSTQLKYLENTYLNVSLASITEASEDERGYYLCLTETIFHPQGGGQPSDRGFIRSEKSEFEVDFVVPQQRIVKHYGTFTTDSKFAKGELVTLEVNQERRLLNARIHTAGELLRLVALRLYPEWQHLKSCHFPEQASVEFLGLIDTSERAEALFQIEKEVHQLINLDLSVETQFIDAITIREMGVQVPSELPSEQFLRVIIIDDEVICCGGTHVKQLSEIGSVSIRKIKSSQGAQIKISYAVN